MTQFLVRRATAADTEALVAFNADILRHQDAEEPDERTGAWTRDLMQGGHPTCRAEDFLVVDDTRTGALVSSLCVIPQSWSYGGVPVRVGQPELVGTLPAYRGQGLVRRQFELMHEVSAARGEQLLAIDGVPWFYRQFGYEMALELRGELSIDAARVPRLDAGAVEPYRVRPATDSDVPFIAPIAARAAARYLMTCCRDATAWRYELRGRGPLNAHRIALRVVEAADGRPVGFIAHFPRLFATSLAVVAYELAPEADWLAVTPSILRYLRSTGEALAESAASSRQARIGFWLGTAHPLYELIQDLGPRDEGAYAWYLRVADLPGFLRHVAPVFERRLATSALADHTGELRLSFYRGGVRLAFERGRLREVTPWRQSMQLAGVERLQQTTAERSGAAFPGLTFLQLLFGYRSLDELQHAFPDCLVRTDDARAVLDMLFPKQPSNVWAVV